MENSIQEKPKKQLTQVEEKMMSVLRVITTVTFVFVLYFSSPLRNPEFKLENFKWNNGDDLIALLAIFFLWILWTLPFLLLLFVLYRVIRRSIIKGK